MRTLRRAARPLLAGIFVVSGFDTFRNPQSRVPMADAVTSKIIESLGLPMSTEDLVRVNAIVQLGAGAALALGIYPRLAALALVGSIVPTTLAGHRFWDESDPRARAMQRTQFLKNAAILGGLVTELTR